MRTHYTREIQKQKSAAMTMELSYLQLKTANDARLTVRTDLLRALSFIYIC